MSAPPRIPRVHTGRTPFTVVRPPYGRTARAALAALVAATVLAACRDAPPADAYGNFEADEVVVSAEVGGRLLAFDATEGRTLVVGDTVGVIDTVQLALERAALDAQHTALAARRTEADRQLAALDAQVEIADRVRARTERLAAGGAATASQRDQAERDARVLAAQRDAARATRARLAAETDALDAQRAAIADRIARATVRNPVRGTVLTELAHRGETVQPGQPLYRIAPLDTLTLRAWVTAPQLAAVAIGRTVTVHVDGPDGTLVPHDGTVSWIASRAEFTPTPVQTRDERAELVYAVKVRVPNPDGVLRIGMPGDVQLAPIAP
jgi:HlyD family secretion protein